MRSQDPRSILCTATYLPHYSKDLLFDFGDNAAATVDRAGVGIALSYKAESVLLDWIPVNSRLCATRLNSSLKVNKNKSTRRTLLVSSGSNDDDIKDQFYADLNELLHLRKTSDIVIVAGDFNAQVGRLSSSERNISGRFSLNNDVPIMESVCWTFAQNKACML